jgi:hypothetical protein
VGDYEACADLCDDRGFARQAALLRAVARGGLRVFAVCERAVDDFGVLEETGGVPRALFLDRADADRDADRRNLLAFRERNLYEYCEGDIGYVTNLTPEEFERGVGVILGAGYTLPDPDTHRGPLLPAGASDEQVRAVLNLFDLQFFHVVELELVGHANPGGTVEAPT